MTETQERPRAGLAFAAIVLAMLPAVLDQTILATALPSVATDLGRLADVSWVVTAYVVAAAVATPLWGKLGDRLGRARLLRVALAWFLAASALCGAAQGIATLAGARALQGVAAGGLMTLAMARVGDLVPPRERGRYQGFIAATFAVATAVGPLLGGLLVDHAGWRWTFYVNLPVGALALLGLARTRPDEPREGARPPLDVAGAVLLAAATAAVMLVCVWGGERLAWGSAPLLGLIGAAAVLVAGLVARERRAADPVVPLHLLRRRVVVVSGAGLFLTTAALFAVTVFAPILLQGAGGATPTEAGLLLVPAMAGIAVSTTASGRYVARTGRYRRIPPVGLALMAGALAILAALAEPDASRTAVAGALVLFGLGFGVVGQLLVTAVQNDVERRELGVATATTGFARALGGAAGAAALGAVFAARIGDGSAAGVAGGARAVFAAAAAVAVAALLVTLLLRPAALRGAGPAAQPAGGPR